MRTVHATDTALRTRIAEVRNAGERLYDTDRARAILLLTMADIAADCHHTQMTALDTATATAAAMELMRWGPAFEAAHALARTSPVDELDNCPRCDGETRKQPRLVLADHPPRHCTHPWHRPEETRT